MSQDDIIKILEKKNEPLTSKELSEYLQIRQQNIIRALRQLIKYKEIKSRCPNKKEKGKLKDRGYESKIINSSRFKVFFIENQ